MIKIHPRRIHGNWEDGFVLDVHSTGSTFLGYDEFGHHVFDTNRTEVGDLLYRLKYKSDTTVLPEIGAVAECFIRSWGIDFGCIVPVPPTRVRRVQPVFLISNELASRFGVPVLENAVKKRKNIMELKMFMSMKNVASFLRMHSPQIALKYVMPHYCPNVVRGSSYNMM